MSSRAVASRWETAISDLRQLSTVSVFDDGVLVITVAGQDEASKRRLWRFSFDCALSYRVTDEAFLNHLWSVKAESPGAGSTFVLDGSPWLEELMSDPVFATALSSRKAPAKHFVIVTGDDGLEVISVDDPEVEETSQ